MEIQHSSVIAICSAWRGFRGGRALGNKLTQSLMVMLANAKLWSFYCKTWYSEYSKWLNTTSAVAAEPPVTSDQWLSGSFKVHQIRFRPGLRPWLHCGSLQRSSRPSSSWLKGPTSKWGKRREGETKRRRGKEGNSQIPGSALNWMANEGKYPS